MDIALRTVAGTLAIWFTGLVCMPVKAQEPLPPTEPSQVPQNQFCPPLDNRPLSALSVDVRPVDADGNLVNANSLPGNCMPASVAEPAALFVAYGPSNFECGCREVLQLARFCHPKLLFEDPMRERYGVNYFCPSCHAVREFTCDLVLLPARLLVYKRQPYVMTPTPHCFSACGACGY